ncbi:DUF5134 domain-containing protein [Streptomyces sp. NPDC053493]|uniref:DUF5134 domain-containing protein n=1 Tax=Streptomyces sp. NPDC053493 TaxID=3365705 RepID=UPI0037CF4D4B
MHGPALSGWLLVVLGAASGAYCLLRMRAGAGEERGAAGSEAVMGFGMAAMALPAAVLTPPEWAWALYAGVFGVAALHGLVAALRHGGHHVHHVVGSLAMVYMALAMSAAPAAHGAHGAGHGAVADGGGIPVLTGALLAYYGVYVLRSGARLVPVAAPVGVGAAGAGAGGVGAAGVGAAGAGPGAGAGSGRAGVSALAGPELTLVCRLSMALATLAMLLTL